MSADQRERLRVIGFVDEKLREHVVYYTIEWVSIERLSIARNLKPGYQTKLRALGKLTGMVIVEGLTVYCGRRRVARAMRAGKTRARCLCLRGSSPRG